MADLALNGTGAKKKYIYIQLERVQETVRTHSIENYAREVSSWVKTGIVAFVTSHKYQMEPQSSLWFTPACSSAIDHRNLVFCMYQRDHSSHNSHLFVTAQNNF